MLLKHLTREIQKRKESNNLRTLSHSQNLIDFSSNDYLGFAVNHELQVIIRNQFNTYQHSSGATGSRLLTGNTLQAEALEKKLAEIFKTEAALILNSGYSANLAVLSSIPKKGDTILYDELAHACIKDGARLSLAKRFSFKHNSIEDLEKKLKVSTGNIFIVIESIYSMDGDVSPLKEIILLAKKYNAEIVLDEAHSTGWMGDQGSGLASSLGLEKDIAIRIHTFGKAMGVHGACICGSKLLIQYLINFARPFIYTTALPPHSLTAIECAFDFLQRTFTPIQQLNNNVSMFLEQTKSLRNISKNQTCIQSLIIPGNQEVKMFSQLLAENNLDVRPILSPTVPSGKERLRICLHAFNTENDIRKLTDILKTAG